MVKAAARRVQMSETTSKVDEGPSRSDAGREVGTTRGWDVAVGLAAAVLVAFHMHASRNFWFIFDDWSLIDRGDSIGDLFEPHNGHLSTLIVLVFRSQRLLFGLDSYFLIRLFGALSLVAIPTCLYFVARRTLPPPLAVLLALPFVLPANVDLFPTAMNHWAAAAFTILLAGALQRGDRRSDVSVALWLSLSLLSAGGGAAAAVGAGLHTMCRRPGVRRWVAVVVPGLTYGLWWTTQSSADTSEGSLNLSGIAKGVWASFEFIGMQTLPGGLLVATGFVVLLVLRTRHGVQAASNSIAWTTAAVFWWTALQFGRGSGVQADLSAVFRYQIVGAALLVLAIIPARHGAADVWIRRLIPEHRRTAATIGALCIALLATIAVNLDDVRSTQRTFEAFSRQARGTLMTVVVQPPLIPDEQQYVWIPATRTAAELRAVVDDVGLDFSSSALDIDERLVEQGLVSVGPIDSIPQDCDQTTPIVDVPPGVPSSSALRPNMSLWRSVASASSGSRSRRSNRAKHREANSRGMATPRLGSFGSTMDASSYETHESSARQRPERGQRSVTASSWSSFLSVGYGD